MEVSRENGYDVGRVRRDFPSLDRDVHEHPLIYLDNAATSQTPEKVWLGIKDM